MVFNSFGFVGFWIVALIILTVINTTGKNIHLKNGILLLLSYIFYGSFNLSFLTILLYITAINYIAGLCMSNYQDREKIIVSIDIILSLIPLVAYKYAEFILKDIFGIPQHDLGALGSLIMPIGISFYTFQALSYTIDLYRHKIPCERNPLTFALFVSFFPTVLSGPIEKARDLLPQLNSERKMSISAIGEGVLIFTWGLFKKIVIADRLSEYVDWVYGNSNYLTGSTIALAAVFYSIQIYCDFSGYSDMAWGVAKSLGFDITRNFNFPYIATSIKDFWRRWHIALTSWFTEYVYFSLGGNRVKYKVQWMFNISMVFILSGVWHGAAWNFLLWGCLHAFYYLIEYFLGLQRKGFVMPKAWRPLAWLTVFILITIAWIFFRIPTFDEACYAVTKIFTDLFSPVKTGASTFTFAINSCLVMTFIAFDWILYRFISNKKTGEIKTTFISGSLWFVSLLLAMAFFGASSDKFVYFQF